MKLLHFTLVWCWDLLIGALFWCVILEIVSNLISPADPFRKWISKRAKRAKRKFAMALPLWRSKISASLGPRRSMGPAAGGRIKSVTRNHRESKSFQWPVGSRMVCRREQCNANANTPTTAPGFAQNLPLHRLPTVEPGS